MLESTIHWIFPGTRRNVATPVALRLFFASITGQLWRSIGAVLLRQFVRHSVVSALYCYRAALALYCCDVPSDVTVHTSNPAVELLHAVYFHLA